MPSPFPGMDPYLESPALWPDAHGALIYTIRAALAAALPDGYTASTDQYAWLAAADPDDRPRGGSPDVFLTNGPSPAPAPPAGGAGVAEPTGRVVLAGAAEVRRKRFIRLVDASDQSVVTVVEVLSPSDKLPKKDRTRYLAKRDEYLGAGANLVELDLLRRGLRLPMGEPEADYYAVVTRADQYPNAAVWAWTVRDPLPALPVPLRPEHGAVTLDLRACLDKAYDESRYGKRIDYAAGPVPPLRKPDAAWAAELLAGRKGGG
jgi:hypothetical protein